MKRPFEEEKIKQGQEFRELTDEQKRVSQKSLDAFGRASIVTYYFLEH